MVRGNRYDFDVHLISKVNCANQKRLLFTMACMAYSGPLNKEEQDVLFGKGYLAVNLSIGIHAYDMHGNEVPPWDEFNIHEYMAEEEDKDEG